MVSMNPNTGQARGFYLDPSGMPPPGHTPLPPPITPSRPSSSLEDPSKKVRKPYTITKSRESWTEPEHDKFLEALQLFDRDWKKIEGFVGSKTVIQIRSHAQKYFMKVQKNGSSERVPPPRPKRKSAHPYPQKAAKIASRCVGGTYEPASTIRKPGYVHCSEASLVITNQPTSALLPTWNYSSTPTSGLMNEGDEELAACATLPAGCCGSSTESAPDVWPSAGASGYRGAVNMNKVMPDFGQVYSFLGSVFDPDARNRLQRLKLMDPINVKTVLLLMKNLSVNLMGPEFDDYRSLLSSYDVESGGLRSCSPAMVGPSHTSKPAIPAV